MRNNKSYNYTDEFSDIVHTARFINAAELSGLFFSAPKWITLLMKIRNAIMKPFGLKRGKDLSDLVHIETENLAKYSLQGTTQGNGLTAGLPPVRFSM